MFRDGNGTAGVCGGAHVTGNFFWNAIKTDPENGSAERTSFSIPRNKVCPTGCISAINAFSIRDVSPRRARRHAAVRRLIEGRAA
ncbi:hypothetical protein EVAR_6452_1 [Eumeta japonica]|uniref:Uncharacterized protein n=1 Tax=Eumeta variegata TaxID=151549 RepID=A0A4C1SQF7_EUMVA|nr:hypothetical protein EVAR_6452_1 [Eumeta japonica]